MSRVLIERLHSTSCRTLSSADIGQVFRRRRASDFCTSNEPDSLNYWCKVANEEYQGNFLPEYFFTIHSIVVDHAINNIYGSNSTASVNILVTPNTFMVWMKTNRSFLSSCLYISVFSWLWSPRMVFVILWCMSVHMTEFLSLLHASFAVL